METSEASTDLSDGGLSENGNDVSNDEPVILQADKKPKNPENNVQLQAELGASLEEPWVYIKGYN